MTHDKTPSTNDLADDPASDPGPLPEGVYSDGALLWRAKPGATTTFEDLLEARELFQDLHNDRDWNPWRFEAAAEALERAKDTVEQWKRAEPGFRQWTASEVEEWMAQRDADFEGEQAERERQRERNLATYNAEREAARLDLLEQRHILARRRLELSQMRSGESFPQIDPERRAAQVSKLEKSVAQLEAEIERLAPVVGDPEGVVDEYGNLPRERRETTLYYYRSRRITRHQTGADPRHRPLRAPQWSQPRRAISPTIRTGGPRLGPVWPIRRRTWASPGLDLASADPLSSLGAWIGATGPRLAAIWFPASLQPVSSWSPTDGPEQRVTCVGMAVRNRRQADPNWLIASLPVRHRGHMGSSGQGVA
ncbi:hypothetical protein ACFX43_10710 [Nocardioides sp. YIM B13467]|uniref:hypothetical protein n=1 Tax=Nocardioides sp. YIM B13467 TaxID=3366294 RepID=UPI00367141AB